MSELSKVTRDHLCRRAIVYAPGVRIVVASSSCPR